LNLSDLFGRSNELILQGLFAELTFALIVLQALFASR